MDQPPGFGTPAEPPLSLDPIVGWRTWNLRRYGGGLVLVSAMGGVTWPPRSAMRSVCSTCGPTCPSLDCTCGLYAADTPKHLAGAGVFNGRTSVVGAVALWGRVIEHERGARAQFGYPARLRLVCATCLERGKGGVVPNVVRESASGEMTAYCTRHPSAGAGTVHDARRIESELLSTYAVDLQPQERVGTSLKLTPRPEPPAPPAMPARREPVWPGPDQGVVLRIITVLTLAYMWFWMAVGVLGLALLVVGALVSPFLPDPTPASIVVPPGLYTISTPDVRIEPEPRWRTPPPALPHINPFRIPKGDPPWR